MAEAAGGPAPPRVTPRRKRRPLAAVGRWLNSGRGAGVLIGAFACVMLGAAVADAASVATLRERGREARAEVVAVHGGKSGYVVVTFRPGGGAPVEATVDDDDWAGWPAVNDVATVVYDPRNPTGRVVDARVGPDYDNALFIGLLGVVLAGLGCLSFVGVIDFSRWPRR